MVTALPVLTVLSLYVPTMFTTSPLTTLVNDKLVTVAVVVLSYCFVVIDALPLVVKGNAEILAVNVGCVTV